MKGVVFTCACMTRAHNQCVICGCFGAPVARSACVFFARLYAKAALTVELKTTAFVVSNGSPKIVDLTVTS